MKTIAVEHASPKQGKIVKIEWNMSKRCNFNCSYCDEFTHDNKSPHISFDVAKQTIDTFVNSLPGKKFRVGLTGGEPCVNPDFEKILDYMYDKGIDVGVTTNGSRTYEFYAKILPKLTNINFSYHMEYHKRDVIPENIVKLKHLADQQDKYVHLHVHMMMLPTMFEEAERTINYLKENGVPVIMRRIRPARIKDHPNSKFNNSGQLIEGPIARPFFDGVVTQKFIKRHQDSKNWHVDYSPTDYYSEEELEYLENRRV
jgi:MoaA/NifB/PqqE/SkfB family radical SAM enzyme